MATTARARKIKQVQFAWEGTDAKGRKIQGINEGPNAAFIRATLRRQGVKPTRIRKKSGSLLELKKRIKASDITFVTRQLSTMFGAGIPVAQALEAIGRGHENPNMRELLGGIRSEVESGTAMSQAIARFPQYFDRLYVSLVAAGETSGTLDVLLEKIAAYKEKIEALKSKIKSAMLYPAAVVLVAVVVVTLLLLFVIPQFEQLFQSVGGDLPTLTKTIVNLSRWFQVWWWLFFLILIASIVSIIFVYKRSPKFQFALDRLLLRLPIFGLIVRKATIARFARTLATMFGAGVPLVDALESVASASGNRVYHNAILNIRNEVSTGRTLESSMAATGLFPSMVLQMVATGEESGELELMLTKVAEFYEREVDDAVAAMSSLIEPLMIVVLGVLVGTMVVAMYLPIFKMASVF